MAFVDDPNKNSQGTQVAGASPLGGGSAPTQDSGSAMGSGASVGGSQSSQIQSDSQVASTNKKAPKASSGTFRNIQKYVEKNKPQAQNMSSAVTQDVGKQAEQIRQAVDTQKQQKDALLNQNTQTIDTSRDWAKNTVGNVMGSNNFNIAENDLSKFHQLSEGKIQGVQDVGNLNLANETSKSQGIQQLAQSANTEQGRRNLLSNTFKKQGDYTRGMSGLDNLITSGDKAARENLITGTQNQADTLQKDITGAMSQFNTSKEAQDYILKNFGSNIMKMGDESYSTVGSDLDSRVAAERKMLADRYGTLDKGATAEYADLLGSLDSKGNFYNQLLENTGTGYMQGSGANFQAGERGYLTALKNLSNNGVNIGGGLTANDIINNSGAYSLKDVKGRALGMGNDSNTAEALGDVSGMGLTQMSADNIEKMLKDANLGLDLSANIGDAVTNAGSKNRSAKTNINTTALDTYANAIANQAKAAQTDTFKRVLENQYKDYGTGFDDFKSGDFIDRSGVATTEDTGRLAALNSLFRKQDDGIGIKDKELGKDKELLDKLYGRFMKRS